MLTTLNPSLQLACATDASPRAKSGASEQIIESAETLEPLLALIARLLPSVLSTITWIRFGSPTTQAIFVTDFGIHCLPIVDALVP